MGNLLRRRTLKQPTGGESWTVLRHNDFDTYYNWKSAKGNSYQVQDNGEWVLVVSNGKNDNGSAFNANRAGFLYADLKDKTIRVTWRIECDDYATMSGYEWSGNVNFSTYSGSWGANGRVSNKTVVTKDIYIGSGSIEFVPSVLFAGLSTGTYFGWNIGFRSAHSGDTIRIKELTVEVKDE